MPPVRSKLAERLREARTQAGLTQEQTAAWLGVRRPAIAEIEAGGRAVKSTELLRLAELFGKSLQWLVQGTESAEERVAAALFRAQEPANPLLKREVAKLARRCRLLGELEEQLGLRRHHEMLPQYPNEGALRDFSIALRHGADVAYQERARLGLGVAAPVRDVWGVIEDAGLHVFPLRLGDKDIDGIFTRLTDNQACVGVNIDKWLFRQVFTVVHEYGHALMDGDTTAEACTVNRGWEVHRSQVTYYNRELRANQFAAVFLVPREALVRYLNARGKLVRGRATGLTPMEIVRAQDHFGTSAEMLLWRLQNEQLIDATERKAIADAINRIGVVSLARALGYDWRDRAQPFGRIQELALKGYAKGFVTLGVLAELFDKPKEEMHNLLRTWRVAQEFAPDDALVGSVQ